MELKQLTERTLELFGVRNVDDLKIAVLDSINKPEILNAFCELVGGDLSKDWMQMIFQYYLADRKEKKQDYTPLSIAQFMGRLAGGAEKIVDICAGSGALIIQKWNYNNDISFTAVEVDENVIPFLLFNMVIRNIRCDVLQMDVLIDEEPKKVWKITKGVKFGNIVNCKSAV